MTKRRASGVDEDLVAAFDAAWERGLEQRIDYSFIKTYRPVIDDVAFSVLGDDGRLPPLVRGERTGVAGVRACAVVRRPLTVEPRRRQAGLR